MNKIFLLFALLFLCSCSTNYATLLLHKTKKNDDDIFTSDPKSAFFEDSYYSKEIYRYQIKFTNKELQEVKRILDSIKKLPELNEDERREGPTDYGLIINNDTIFGYGGSVYCKKKAFYVRNNVIQNKIEELEK